MNTTIPLKFILDEINERYTLYNGKQYANWYFQIEKYNSVYGLSIWSILICIQDARVQTVQYCENVSPPSNYTFFFF